MYKRQLYGPKEKKNNEYGVISRVLDSRRCISKEVAIKNKFRCVSETGL